MTTRVTVCTGARLHFGPLSWRPKSGRHFGGVGLMIDQPGCEVIATASEEDRVTVCPASSTQVAVDTALVERVTNWVARYRLQAPVDPGPCYVQLVATIPRHVGFGSGTQAALAIAAALSRLSGERDVDTVELARRVGRGERSAVGIHGFAQGGLIVDGGRDPLEGDAPGPLADRVSLPDAWRIVLLQAGDQRGRSGESERRAFAQLPPMPAALTRRLTDIVGHHLLPAARSGDCTAFGEALFTYGQAVGEFFAPVQGGCYMNPATATLVEWMRSCGIPGVAQSSWGPTVAAVCPDAATADDLVRRSRIASPLPPHRVAIASPRNAAATIVTGN